MQRYKTNAGKLRTIGYDSARSVLRVELEDGSALEYANVGESIWRTFKNSSAQWSYYHDNIEDAFTATRATRTANDSPGSGKNPLDDLFA